MTSIGSHQTVRLRRGKHASPEKGVCVMELASMLAGEPFSDRPQAVCPVIGAYLRSYNDVVDDDRRQDLYRYASAAVGTHASTVVTRARAQRCVEELRALRRWPFGPFTGPRASPESVPGMERLAGRLARELHRSGVGGHTRALAFADGLLAMGPVATGRPVLSESAPAREAASAR